MVPKRKGSQKLWVLLNFHHHFAEGVRSSELNMSSARLSIPTTSGKWIPEQKSRSRVYLVAMYNLIKMCLSKYPLTRNRLTRNNLDSNYMLSSRIE